MSKLPAENLLSSSSAPTPRPATPPEASADDAADHGVALGIPRIRPQPVGSPPAPPPPRRPASPLPDLPTQHLFLPPDLRQRLHEQQGRLSAPESWSADEGTAALLLPADRPHALGAGSAQSALPPARQGTPRVRSALTYLLMGAVGGGLLLALLLGGGLLWRLAHPPAAVALADAEQRRLIDDALVAVAGGQADRALRLLQRFQQLRSGGPDQPDLAVELMIDSIRRRLPAGPSR